MKLKEKAKSTGVRPEILGFHDHAGDEEQDENEGGDVEIEGEDFSRAAFDDQCSGSGIQSPYIDTANLHLLHLRNRILSCYSLS